MGTWENILLVIIGIIGIIDYRDCQLRFKWIGMLLSVISDTTIARTIRTSSASIARFPALPGSRISAPEKNDSGRRSRLQLARGPAGRSVHRKVRCTSWP